jgi:hypothetical protein
VVEKRWEGDERGHGVASAAPFAPGVTALQEHLDEEDWITEDPHAHLLPHIARACSAVDDVTLLESRLLDDGVLEVVLDWQPTIDSPPLRYRVFGIIGSFAETSTHVAQRPVDGSVEYEVVTGVLPEHTHFRTHGHLVRFLIVGAPAPHG